MQQSKILLLGAYGLAGRAILDELAGRGLPVTAAGRDADRLRRVVAAAKERKPGASIASSTLDAEDEPSLFRALEKHELVVNCIGPYLRSGERIARAAISARTHYIDIASEQEHYRRLTALDKTARDRGVLLGTGFGAYPGLSGLIARQLLDELPDARRIEIALAMATNPAGEGLAQLMTGALEMTFPLYEFNAGRLEKLQPGRSSIRDLPAPFGRSRMFRWPQLEVLAFARHDRDFAPALKEMRTFIAPGNAEPPAWLKVQLVRLLAPQRREWSYRLIQKATARIANERARHAAALPGGTEGGVIVVRAWNEQHARRAEAAFHDSEAATAWLPVLAAESLLMNSKVSGKPGDALAASGLRTAVDFFSAREVIELIQERGGTLRFTDEQQAGA